jgi:hypothetical protein
MTTRADRVAQVVELLLSKCKALNSNPLPPKKKKKREREKVTMLRVRELRMEMCQQWKFR